MMPNKEREESIPSLLTDAYSSLRFACGAAKRGRWVSAASVLLHG
jgi:hypothetical protein